MINSILDNDLYKFTTSYAYMRKFPHAMGTFEFFDRNKEVYDQAFIDALQLEFWKLASIEMTNSEFNWASTHINFIPKWYWEWLKGFRYDPNELHIALDEEGHLHITASGNLYRISLWEIPVLCIVSELSYKESNQNILYNPIDRLVDKVAIAVNEGIKFSEFGTRRRYSYFVQDEICKYLSKNVTLSCLGTSNCHFAMKYGMKAMGTHPHEWFMFHGAQFGYKNANYLALENWQEVFDGDLGIALTDTYTSDIFLKNFSMKHAKLFDGVRHDSGDPFKFTNKVIDRYVQLGIDPMSKTIVFSDSLTFSKAKEIKQYCQNRIKCSFGIGTNLTNDVGVKPKNIVMKLTSCRMTPNTPIYNCVKLSDDIGKHIGENVDICMKELEITDKNLK